MPNNLDAYGLPFAGNTNPTAPTTLDAYGLPVAASTQPSTQKNITGRNPLSLEERALRKAAKQGYVGDDLLGMARANEFYDADTLYSDDFAGGVRVGNELSSTDIYANAPEKNKYGAQTAEYLASRVALDRYAQGLPAETKEFYDELRSDPAKLAKYQTELSKAQGDLLQVRGEQGKVGVHGRQVGQVYNPNLNGESLQDRLMATGNASMYDHGQEKTRAGNAVDAAQYGIGRTAAGIADAVVDGATRVVKEGYKFFTDSDEKEATAWINDSSSLFERDATGDFVGFDDYKEAETYGYDNSRTKAVMSDIAKSYNEGTATDVAGSILAGVATAGPEFFLESLGEMAAMMTGGVALKGAAALGKSATAAKTIGATTSKISNRMLAANYGNQILEDRQDALDPGQEISNIDRAIALAGGSAMMLLNKAGVDEIVGNTKFVKAITDNIAKPLGMSTAMNTLKILAAKTAEVTGKGAYEGLEEVAQEIVQKIAAEQGTEKMDEFWSSETGLELVQAFGGGFAGGATPGAVGAAYDVAKPFVAEGRFADAVNKAGEYATTAKDAVGATTTAAKNLKAKATAAFEVDIETKRQKMMESEDYQNASEQDKQAIDAAFNAKAEQSKAEYTIAQEDLEDAEGASMSTPDEDVDSGPIEPVDKPTTARDAQIAVLKTTPPVSATTEDGQNTPEVDSGLKAFDENFASILEALSAPIENIKGARAELEKLNKIDPNESPDVPAEVEAQYTEGVAAAAENYIAKLTQLKNDIGAGENATAAMEAKISTLLPMVTANSTVELDAILTSPGVTNKQKVRAVLGSSAASIKLMEDVANDPETSALDKKLVEAKITAIETYQEVSGQKILGGGFKPGVFQWLSQIQEDGTVNDIALANIQAFVEGQRSKLQAFKNAKAKADAAPTGKKTARVEYGTKPKVYDIGSLNKLIKVIEEESTSMEMLMDIANEAAGTPNTTTVAQKQPKKAETKKEPQVVPKTPKEAPTPTEDINRPTKKVVPKYVGKIILANAGTGKSVASQEGINVVDGDDLLIEAVNEIIKEDGGKPITSVSVLNDIWIGWGKGTNDTKAYDAKRKRVYEIQARKAKEASANGKTVLIASARQPILDIVDYVMYQGDTATLKKSRASKKRDNVLEMTDAEIVAKNAKFTDNIKDIPDNKKVTLPAGAFIGDQLFDQEVNAVEVEETNPEYDEVVTEPVYDDMPEMELDEGDFEQGEEVYMDVEEVDTTPVEDVPVKPKVEKTISKGQTKRDEGTIRADMEANLDAALELAPVGIKSRIKKIISDCKG